MKRLLMFCGLTALLLVPAALADKPTATQTTLALTSCVSPCVMAPTSETFTGWTITVTFQGSGYNPKGQYEQCITGPTLNVCSGIAVNPDGTVLFQWGNLSHAGSYTVQTFSVARGKQVVPAAGPVAFDLVTA